MHSSGWLYRLSFSTFFILKNWCNLWSENMWYTPICSLTKGSYQKFIGKSSSPHPVNDKKRVWYIDKSRFVTFLAEDYQASLLVEQRYDEWKVSQYPHIPPALILFCLMLHLSYFIPFDNWLYVKCITFCIWQADLLPL